MKEPAYVVLYNPISNEGQLDSWHVLFVRLLLAAGHNVIAMTSDPEGITRKLASHGVRPGQRLLIVRTAWATSSNSDHRLIDRLRLLWADQNARWDALRFQRNWRLYDGCLAENPGERVPRERREATACRVPACKRPGERCRLSVPAFVSSE